MKLSIEGLTFYILFFVLLIGLTFAFTNTLNQGNNDYVQITVSEGDSLWSLNETYKELHPYDFEEFVNWIESNNNIKAESIKSGDQLVLPIYFEKDVERFTAFVTEDLNE
ncbi:cell division suppressor protein YneA [Litchfieldia alkalitelluris]|uniref:cell division suppressor protein YneA n=1 Tax=Litchfieldia alkalitelluris TaxID=304268 RepID=UPI0009985083|nr:hypothetical protein [Litchfieldia alkalitelluris]